MDLAGLRVLVVEDQALVAATIAASLRDAGYQALGPVRTLQGALEQVGQEEFDAAVLDLNLYGEWAEPVADVLIELKLPVVLLTGYERSDLPDRFRPFVYCQKPWHPDQLLHSVEQSVQLARSALAG
jgi:CheY-like chemotaxis protein